MKIKVIVKYLLISFLVLVLVIDLYARYQVKSGRFSHGVLVSINEVLERKVVDENYGVFDIQYSFCYSSFMYYAFGLEKIDRSFVTKFLCTKPIAISKFKAYIILNQVLTKQEASEFKVKFKLNPLCES